MATAGAIVLDAMIEIGAYAAGATVSSLSAAHAQLGLRWFQRQLNAWQADALTLNLQTPNAFTLTSGTSEFTIGPTGDLVVTRPVYVEGVNYVIPGTTPTTEVQMALMDDDQYMALSQKTLGSSLPQQWHLNATVPNATMFIWPQVTQNVVLAIYLYAGIDEPVSMTSTVTGPQGYAEAFHFQLALRLCGPMARPIPDGLPEMAAAALARMKRPNVDPGIMGLDAALAPTYAGAFNVLTGTMTGPNN